MNDDSEATRSATAADVASTVAIGDVVISWDDDEAVEYGGQADSPGRSTLTVHLLAKTRHTRTCDPDHVAPATVAIPERGARVDVAKRPREEMPQYAAGPWKLTLPGVAYPSWHRTRRDATATGLRRLAIMDWHGRQAAADPPHEFRPRDFTAPDYNYLTSEQRTILAWLADHPLSTGPDIQAGTGLPEAVCAEYVTYLAWDGILAADEQGRLRILGEDEEPPMIVVELDDDQAAALHEVINENLAGQANLGHPPQEA